jgi:hypothetical protein
MSAGLPLCDVMMLGRQMQEAQQVMPAGCSGTNANLITLAHCVGSDVLQLPDDTHWQYEVNCGVQNV